MQVKIRFFAGPREQLGVSELVQVLPAGATVQALVDALIESYPDLGSFRCKYAVNSAYVTMEAELHDGDEVACIPPVGGG
jgi:molybdopterin synthase sulfur carrier subunit